MTERGDPGGVRAGIRRQATTTALIYLGVAGLWILLSDRLLGAAVDDAELFVQLSVVKGFGFVAVTGLLLHLLVRRNAATIERAFVAVEENEAERSHQVSVVEREQRFANTLVESMPGVFYLYDQNGRFLRWNQDFERVSGYSAEEMADMQPLDFFEAADKERVAERIREVFETGASSVEAGFLAKDGQSTPYYFTGKRIEFEGATCLVGVGVDIETRRHAEEELRKSEDRYRSTLESILEGCQILDFDWEYLYLNGAAAIQNRRPNAELLGSRMPDAWPGITKTPLFSMLRHCMENRVPRGGEIELAFPDGDTGWFDVRVQPVREGIFVLSIDISERKEAERALRELNEALEIKIAERTRDLDAARERAESADRLKSAFLATMSHELRTPLNSILGFTGIVLQRLAGPLNAEQAKQLGMVQTSARHLLALISDVLDISKIEAGQLEVHVEAFDVAASIERASSMVAPFAEKKGLSLRIHVPESMEPFESDRRRVEQIVLNLLNNAIKFTDEGEVTLTVENRPEDVRIVVTDTGIGIRKEDVRHLFQPFRQIDSGIERVHEGTGLGLAICQRLSQLLGGTIEAESTWDEGSVFTVTLPRHGT